MTQQRTNWLQIAILWTAGIAAAMQFAKFSVAFDALTALYGAKPALVGLALSIVGMVGLVFGVSAGVLSGYIGYRRVLIAGLVIGAVTSATQALLPPLPIMIASRIVEGVSHLGIVVTAPTMMASVSSEGHRSIVMGLWGTFFGVAFALMAWLGTPIIAQHGVGRLLLAHGLFMAGLAACVLVVIKRPDTSHDVDHAALPKLQLSMFIRENLKVYANMRTALPGLIFLFHTSMFIALLTFLPRLSGDPGITALLLVVLPLVGITGAFCAGAIAQYLLSPVPLTLIAYGAISVGVVIVHWTISTGAGFVSASMALIFVTGIVPGAVFAMIPFLSARLSDQASANGAVVQLGNIGSTIGPPVFAGIISASGSFGLMVAIIILCFCGIGVGLLAAAYTRSPAHTYS
jgi:MFS transporter, AAHS family, 3-hydroxyphenylpropionic acid transporter